MSTGFLRKPALDTPDGRKSARAACWPGTSPTPAMAVDRHWTLVMANAVVPRMMAGVEEAALRLLGGP